LPLNTELDVCCDTTHGKQPPSSTRIHAKVPIEVTAMD
jgi:hypothetical protein